MSLICRMSGIRSFGIEDNKFIVYVDSVSLDDDSLLRRIKRSVGSHHNVDKSSLQAWQKPVFHHHRIGDLIEGEDKAMGMITTFAERVDINGKIHLVIFILLRVNTLHPENKCECSFSDVTVKVSAWIVIVKKRNWGLTCTHLAVKKKTLLMQSLTLLVASSIRGLPASVTKPSASLIADPLKLSISAKQLKPIPENRY